MATRSQAQRNMAQLGSSDESTPDGEEGRPRAVTDPVYEQLQAQAQSQAATNDLLRQLIATMAQQTAEAQQTQTDLLRFLASGSNQQNGAVPSDVQRQNLSQASNSSSAKVKPPDPKSPKLLESDITLAQFEEWRATYRDYVACYQLDSLPVAQQTARFRTLLSLEMRAELKHSVGVDEADNLSPDEILDKIRAHIRAKRNVALDRVAFEERRQKDGEKFDDFYVSLRTTAANADLCPHCYDTRLTTRIMVGTSDPETRRMLLSMTPFPSLQETVNLCRSQESGRRDEQDLSAGKVAIDKVYKFRQPDSQLQRRSRSNRRMPPKPQGTSLRERCSACGYLSHIGFKCPAYGQECRVCGGRNHFAKVCRKRNQEKDRKGEDTRRVTSVALRVDSTAVESVQKAPQVKMDIYDSKSRWLAETDVTPDSAAEATAASSALLSQMGLNEHNLVRDDHVRLVAANAKDIRCVGFSDLCFKLQGRSFTDRVYFCDGQKGVLLSWYACKNLRILPVDYPNPCRVHAVDVNLPTYSDTPKLAEVEVVVGPLAKEPDARQRTVIREKLISQFLDVFDSTEVRPMKCPPLKIVLRDGAVPFAMTVPRKIPIPWMDKVKLEIDKMVAMDVAEKVDDEEPSEWCHPLVSVPKPNGDVRVCVDMTKLNPYVIRPLHPFPAPREAVSSIPTGCRYFSVFDATKGYWQMRLDKESQKYTTFLTPWGRYRFTRAPMGLVSTGDEFCFQEDKALIDIGNIRKVVDDSIEYDTDFREHVVRVFKTLVRCREKGITLNRDKFVFAEPEVNFCGYVVNSEGAKAHPKKLKAIQEFPQPTSITELRSFLGLVNQLSCFTPRLAQAAEPLRPLLSTKNTFLWQKVHSDAFEAVKEVLVSPPILASFDISRQTKLSTDASRNKGLGFTLQQLHGAKWRIVECGSRFISGSESRWATVELEMLGVLWAITKCKLYLQGLPRFDLYVDHKPLIPILNDKTLADLENTRLIKMKEKLSTYVYTAHWVKGKDHVIPDILSRAPVDEPSPEDSELEKEINEVAQESMCWEIQAVFAVTADLALKGLREAAEKDADYNLLKANVLSGFLRPVKNNAFVATFEKFKGELSVSDGLVMYGNRIVIPRSERKSVLGKLHASHQGIVKTQRRARQCVYWPSINSDIENLTKCCEKCQENLPSQTREPMISDPKPEWVFQEVGVDLFSHAGYHYMVYVDRLSGWPVVVEFGKHDPDSKEVIKTIRQRFASLGVPIKLRSDNGPQFASREFKSFLLKWGVEHVTSSPRYPQSNGLAEAAVKAMKTIVQKTTVDGKLNTDEYMQAILEYRNTPRDIQVSPAEMVFGHNLRSHVPAHRVTFSHEWKEKMQKAENESEKLKVRSEEYYNRTARPLVPFKMKESVCVQEPVSRKWTLVGTVVGRNGARRYLVKLSSGRIFWRNRRFLRKNHISVLPEGEEEGRVEDSPKFPKQVHFKEDTKVIHRRSSRERKAPERFSPA